MINLKDKKVAILGLGEENFALTRYLINKGAKVTVCDKKSKEELGEYYEEVAKLSVEFCLGEDYLKNLSNFEEVFRTPGLPYLTEEIQKAIKDGVEVSSEIKLFFELCPCPIIGVTGTKGKGTTSSLIFEILKTGDSNHVYLGGNIGNPPINFLDKLTSSDIVVLELSSFQLQDLNISPHIAVVLDIKQDHLDIHKNISEYISAKENIVANQKKDDFAVINDDYDVCKSFSEKTKAKIYYFSRRKILNEGAWVNNEKGIILNINSTQEDIINISDIKLRGEHNLENICAAVLASALAGAEASVIREVIKNFKGLEHRLELVGESGGVKYYNDSFSTTPDTTIAAIKSFSEPIILFLGGSEKNADYKELANAISESSVKMIISIGQTSKRIIENINKDNIKIIDKIQSMDEALRIANEYAGAGDVVLLSPASASFDCYKNYKQRGESFKKEVLGLK